MSKDYVVTMRVRNGRIIRLMRERGFATAAQLARAAGVTPQELGHIINMRRSPVLQTGEWRKPVLALAGALGCLPEDMFNEQQTTRPIAKNTVDLELDASDVAALLTGNPEDATWAKIEVDKLLGQVTPRERAVVQARMAGETLDDIARDMGVHRERIRQIEAKAHRKMRQAARRTESNVTLGLPAIGIIADELTIN